MLKGGDVFIIYKMDIIIGLFIKEAVVNTFYFLYTLGMFAVGKTTVEVFSCI